MTDKKLKTDWPVGTRLVGDEGYGPTTIRLTYVSDQIILAVREETPDGRDVGHESLWSLTCRKWQEAS